MFHVTRAGCGTVLDSCGKKGKIIACFDASCSTKPRGVAACCHRIICPVCKQQAIDRDAQEVADRLENLRRLWRQEGKDLREPRHFIFSPDDQAYWTQERVEADGGESLWSEYNKIRGKSMPFYRLDWNGQRISEERFQSLSRETKRKCKFVSFDNGGVSILHCEREKFFWDGEWISKKYLPSDVDPAKVPRKWVWGVHFHMIGYAYLIRSDLFNAKYKWIYKNIDDADNDDNEGPNQRDVYETVKYQLSHASVMVRSRTNINGQLREKATAAYRYFGLMSNSKGGKRTTSKEWVDCECEECKKAGRSSFLHEYRPILLEGERLELPDRMQDLGVHRVLEVVVEWYINKERRRKRVQSQLYHQNKGLESF